MTAKGRLLMGIRLSLASPYSPSAAPSPCRPHRAKEWYRPCRRPICWRRCPAWMSAGVELGLQDVANKPGASLSFGDLFGLADAISAAPGDGSPVWW